MIQKKYIAIVGLALTVAFSSACVGNQPPENGSTEYSTDSVLSSSSSSRLSGISSAVSSGNASSAVTEGSAPSETITSAPKSEPTILIGMDGKPVYAHEIAEITGSNGEPLTVDRLTADNEYVSAVCMDFAYLKESTGVTFNMHDAPELFGADYKFTGEIPANTNEWRRVNVGDTICGLTLSKAETRFKIPDKRNEYDFPEKYYDGISSTYEFDGELTMTGYLYADKRDMYDPDGGMLFFDFGDKPLPLKAMSANSEQSGFDAKYNISAIYGTDFIGASECDFIQFDKTYHNTEVDMTGIGPGDLVRAKVTISHLTLTSNVVTAHLENVEVLSDVIMHMEDTL